MKKNTITVRYICGNFCCSYAGVLKILEKFGIDNRRGHISRKDFGRILYYYNPWLSPAEIVAVMEYAAGYQTVDLEHLNNNRELYGEDFLKAMKDFDLYWMGKFLWKREREVFKKQPSGASTQAKAGARAVAEAPVKAPPKTVKTGKTGTPKAPAKAGKVTRAAQPKVKAGPGAGRKGTKKSGVRKTGVRPRAK